MPTWLPPTADEQPEVSLVAWGAFDVLVPELGSPTIHVVGIHKTDGEGRVSSPVSRVDGPNRSVVTRTGRVYRLVGPPGLQGDAKYVFGCWVRDWSAQVLSDATPALVRAFDAGETHDSTDTV